MYIDRGMKKWRGMMLPEHVELLKRWREKEEINKPILDEQQLQEFERTVEEAIEFHLPLCFTCIIDQQIETITGFIHYYDEMNKILKVINLSNEPVSIPVPSIVHIKFQSSN
ncbi:MAG TPA: YolD-like family protein [Massilibacterium sp.]|nr:YolD-like family protein [Massilibacterium sp.]